MGSKQIGKADLLRLFHISLPLLYHSLEVLDLILLQRDFRVDCEKGSLRTLGIATRACGKPVLTRAIYRNAKVAEMGLIATAIIVSLEKRTGECERD